MKAYVIHRHGGPEVFEPATLPDPQAGPGQLRIRVHASSVNPLDVKIRKGLVRSGPEFPAILNGDVAGIVDQVGDGVLGFQAGDAVIGCAGGVRGHPGALADYMVADANLVTQAPKRLPLEECAVLPLVFMTAWNALVDRADIQPGEHVLVHAGTGGVGHVAVQLAKARGARVATTVSSEQKAAIARDLGADDIILYRQEPVADYVQRLTGGAGFPLVFDTVGGDNLDASFEAAAVSARVCSINTRSTHDLSPLHAKNLTLHVIFRSVPLLYGLELKHQSWILSNLAEMVEAGTLRPLLAERRFTFAQIADAHRYLESGQAVGKILLTRDGDKV
ncbi:zinc-dependent alcohol dehydrogenase family protein [Thioalkalivibrio paradoxus]|uniref:Quinone oxidoreductase n=1 Tax=Thioalkalivibrio paradoxus ARh 1 TaxID=713585 RepID=W0DGE8_9GAMM|nr:zinc-dependent alcohol dehydrogenase family protein [Thioalkalivibrio paradoxus]AHE97441.1 quinone oxidoreductase [Thioalkalivibrio paradoxus ARh 1]